MFKKICRNPGSFAATGSVLLLLGIHLTMYAQSGKKNTSKRLVDYVNQLIGTEPITDKEYLGNNPAPVEELYYGCVNPGAMVPEPNGKICRGPVKCFDGERNHVRDSGYRYTDTTIMGFANLNGECQNDNKLLFVPTTGPIRIIPGSRVHPLEGYQSAKDTMSEKASAGYYTVFLTTYRIKVELTATHSCGFQRYTFPGPGRKINSITYGDKKIDDYFITQDDLKKGKQLIITTSM